MRFLPALALLVGCHNQLEEVDVSQEPGAAFAAWEDASAQMRVETFAWGGDAQTPVVDFLFVLDPSVSMTPVIDRVQRAFDTLAASDAFPSKSRVAVLTTLPAHPQKLRRVHPAVDRFDGIDHLPGFRDLVDDASIQAFRAVAAPKHAEAYPIDGCGPWFTPDQRNAQGTYCLTAHTQVPLAHVRAEAGLVAVEQWVGRHLTEPQFRSGAAVNIIFVSDTHDPGISGTLDRPAFQSLLELVPDPARLETTIRATQPLSALRFHAIAPYTECGEPWSPLGATYLKAAKTSGGSTLDMCTATDYTDFIRHIAQQGSQPEHGVFPLGRDASKVDEVLIDGRPVPARQARPRVVEVAELDPGRAATVEVRYSFTPVPGVVSRPPRDRSPAKPRPLLEVPAAELPDQGAIRVPTAPSGGDGR